MATSGFAGSDRTTSLFVTGLKNAHAMEKRALSIMTPQVRRIEHYPWIEESLPLVTRRYQQFYAAGTDAAKV